MGVKVETAVRGSCSGTGFAETDKRREVRRIVSEERVSRFCEARGLLPLLNCVTVLGMAGRMQLQPGEESTRLETKGTEG